VTLLFCHALSTGWFYGLISTLRYAVFVLSGNDHSLFGSPAATEVLLE
jgi:hypothetical protein